MNENNLLNLREYHDLYQKDIAKAIGVSRRTYSSWETNTKIIPLKHLNSISNYYDVSMDYILGLSSKKKNGNINKILKLDKSTIGSKIKQVREKHNLTISNLAKELNTTPSTISAYEHGKTLILTAFAYQICKKYKISLDWLCGKNKEL